jgi:hypothetical protein
MRTAVVPDHSPLTASSSAHLDRANLERSSLAGTESREHYSIAIGYLRASKPHWYSWSAWR